MYGNLPIPDMVCTKSGNCRVVKDDDHTNSFDTVFFSEGEKYDISENRYVYDGLNKLWIRVEDEVKLDDDTKVFRIYDKGYCDGIIYIDEATVKNFFRPMVHKHLEVKVFHVEKEINEWLKTLPIDSVKDIRPFNDSWFLVTFINPEDD